MGFNYLEQAAEPDAQPFDGIAVRLPRRFVHIEITADLDHDRVHALIGAVLLEGHVGADEGLVDSDSAEVGECLCNLVGEVVGGMEVVGADADLGPTQIGMQLVGQGL